MLNTQEDFYKFYGKIIKKDLKRVNNSKSDMRVVDKEEFRVEGDEFLSLIRDGAVFIHPTDTIYGIGCNALDKTAVNKIRELKKRPNMPFSVIAPSKDWILENCEADEKAEKYINELPGPVTLILKLKNKDSIADNVAPGLDTIGVRMPRHWFTQVAKVTKLPIVTTSANIVGENFMTTLANLDNSIRKGVDFIIYEDEKKGRPSKIINLIQEEVDIKER
ncbi:threonylcarbamoyl-AMP synthase [Candidatus Woesearchaeota archaeon]|nr:threonylcarbamoyl-AMP synthase [Candidatus Woesearchaeota archaeon]MBL7050859.1 threonylcarbamoyl-AMP synthase [Candidatus Woesearchaeota archaeon]